MPCTQCMAPYTAFRKEQGCSKCGFGFCANCLKHKAIIPGLVDRPVSVCVQCYRKLTEPNAEVPTTATTTYITNINVQPSTNNISDNIKWWGDDELPPPSMRHLYQPVAKRCFQPKSPKILTAATTSKPKHEPPPYSEACALSTSTLQNRLDKLKQEHADIRLDGREVATVNDIEERLAALRGVSVEEIRKPSLVFARKRGEQHAESAKDLIKKAHDEIRIETKWDPVKDLERRYNKYHNIEVNRDDDQMEEKHFANLNEKNPYGQSAAAASSSATNDDIVMGENTIQEMKDLKRTLILAEQESMDAGTVVAANDQSLKLEMKKFAKLTRQESIKNERITEELGKFWDRNLDKYGNGDGNENNNGNKDGNEIDEEELQKIILEAEKVENEVHETVKESKKVRPKGNGFLSKFFGHSSRQ